ncbi:hypothetical protein BJ741DRAFT_670910 [Chytriomyces cf. hyalinus JEL632]|nr:hypothetical protein BJ741DRAFT_670910 [Chytriomyces cf. hyalinus JEL632]
MNNLSHVENSQSFVDGLNPNGLPWLDPFFMFHAVTFPGVQVCDFMLDAMNPIPSLLAPANTPVDMFLMTHYPVPEQPYSPSLTRSASEESDARSQAGSMTSRTEPRKFACPYPQCPKAFKFKAGLAVHIRVHTGERPFECKQCNKTFQTKNQLTVHERVHFPDDTRYSCEEPGCNYRGKQLCDLKDHSVVHMSMEEKVVTSAMNLRNIPCRDCGRLYKTNESLRLHQVKVHGAV